MAIILWQRFLSDYLNLQIEFSISIVTIYVTKGTLIFLGVGFQNIFQYMAALISLSEGEEKIIILN